MRQIAHRIGWGVADQALSSATNFALAVLVARSVDTRDFGVFGIVFAAYTVFLNASRAISTQPLLIRFSAAEPSIWKRGAKQATATALWIGILGGLICLVVAFITSGTMRNAFLVLGLTLPGLLLQDAWRFAFFAVARGGLAMINDLVWAVCLFPSIVIILTVRGHSSVAIALFIWGASAMLAALVGIGQARVLPALGKTPAWLTDNKDLAPRLAGMFVARNLSGLISVYAVAAFGGLVSAGSFRGGQILLGPLNVVFLGVNLIAVPEGVRSFRTSGRALMRMTRSIGLGLAAAALVWGLIVFTLPTTVGTALLGSTWLRAHRLVLPFAFMMAGAGAQIGAFTGVLALAAAKRALRTQVVEGLLTVLGATVGAAIGKEMGAAIGLAIAYWIEAGLWWWQFGRALQEAEQRLPAREAPPGEQPATLLGSPTQI